MKLPPIPNGAEESIVNEITKDIVVVENKAKRIDPSLPFQNIKCVEGKKQPKVIDIK